MSGYRGQWFGRIGKFLGSESGFARDFGVDLEFNPFRRMYVAQEESRSETVVPVVEFFTEPDGRPIVT